MKEIHVGKAKTFMAPAGATGASVYHEWESETLVTGTTFSAGSLTFTPDSIGVYKIVWTGTTSVDHYASVAPLVGSSEFFTNRPELESFEEKFAESERVARFIIERYTGQRFGPYVEKTLTLQGDGGDSLVLPLRLTSLTSIIDNYGYDLTDFVQVSHSNDEIIQNRAAHRISSYDFDTKRDISSYGTERFPESKDFTITGNWGWEYVPPEVSQAAFMLISDSIAGEDAFELRKKGVYEAQLGDFSLKLNADQWGTTGNIQADLLLSNHINYGIELI